jgi:hypothetical protein
MKIVHKVLHLAIALAVCFPVAAVALVVAMNGNCSGLTADFRFLNTLAHRRGWEDVAPVFA